MRSSGVEMGRRGGARHRRRRGSGGPRGPLPLVLLQGSAFRLRSTAVTQYMINEEVRDAAPSSLTDIKEFTSAVSVDISSIFPQSDFFTMYQTNLFQTLQTAGLSTHWRWSTDVHHKQAF
ncbi:hypothetical protein U9M48_022847 [Paspalum notatum var. saurae]|uniref:Uncharacterized protein n=1 Tax=Paspalum notatum var. saurae TaxID=547442 RepID=A0AAQ3TLT7_PASNO